MSGDGSAGTGPSGARSWDGGKVRIFGGILAVVLALDVATKLAVQRAFRPYQQVELLGEYVRLTYIFNPGAAFGIHVGDHSRVIFLLLSLVALAALLAMYWVTPARNRVRLAAISLVCGGAVGNLIDRIRSERGVIDFVDIGVADVRWPVFNVADVAVTTGAILLALSLWQEEHGHEHGQGRGEEPVPPGSDAGG